MTPYTMENQKLYHKNLQASDATQLKELKDLATQLGITVDIDAMDLVRNSSLFSTN